VGPRGISVLAIAGIAGVLFGVSGWNQSRAEVVSAPPVTAGSSPAPAAGSSPAAASSPAPAATGTAGAAAGPQLSSMPYASFAYEVWPGPVSASGKIALSRWTLTVTRQAGGITVKAAHDGQAMTSVSHFYPGGAKVYILDSDVSDNSPGNTDEGLEVTNAQGQVLP
jgi:hypothetical protein